MPALATVTYVYPGRSLGERLKYRAKWSSLQRPPSIIPEDASSLVLAALATAGASSMPTLHEGLPLYTIYVLEYDQAGVNPGSIRPVALVWDVKNAGIVVTYVAWLSTDDPEQVSAAARELAESIRPPWGQSDIRWVLSAVFVDSQASVNDYIKANYRALASLILGIPSDRVRDDTATSVTSRPALSTGSSVLFVRGMKGAYVASLGAAESAIDPLWSALVEFSKHLSALVLGSLLYVVNPGVLAEVHRRAERDFGRLLLVGRSMVELYASPPAQQPAGQQPRAGGAAAGQTSASEPPSGPRFPATPFVTLGVVIVLMLLAYAFVLQRNVAMVHSITILALLVVFVSALLMIARGVLRTRSA